MKSLACGDLMSGCGATFEAESERDLLTAVAAHAREAHGVEHMSADLVNQVRAAIAS